MINTIPEGATVIVTTSQQGPRGIPGDIALGTIIEAPVVPDDGTWLECDGTSYLRSAYPGIEANLPDGVTWTRHTDLPVGWGLGTHVGIVTNGGAYLLVDYDNNKMWRTTDFVNFTDVLNKRLSLGYLNGALVGINGLDLYTSTDDGLTWTTINIATSNPSLTGLYSGYLIRGSARNNTELLLVSASFTGGANHFLASTNGVTFTKHTINDIVAPASLYMVEKRPEYPFYSASAMPVAGLGIPIGSIDAYLSKGNDKNVWSLFAKSQEGGNLLLANNANERLLVEMCPAKIKGFSTEVTFGRVVNDIGFMTNMWSIIEPGKIKSFTAKHTENYVSTSISGMFEVSMESDRITDIKLIFHKAPTLLSGMSGYNYAYPGSLSGHNGKTLLALDKFDSDWNTLPAEFWVIEDDPLQFVTPYIESNEYNNKVFIKAAL